MKRIEPFGPPLRAAGSTWSTRRRHTIEQLVEVLPAIKRRVIESDHHGPNGGMPSVTPHQADALCLLARAGAMSMNDLARNLNIAFSTATALADRLLKQGQVERIADPGDRRVVRLGLTAGAEDTVRYHLASRRDAFLSALEVLDDTELDTLLALMMKVAAGPSLQPVED